MLHLFPYLLFISALLLYNCNWPASGPRIISYRLWVQQTVWGALVAPLILVLLTSCLKLTLLGSGTGQEQKQFLQALVIGDEVSEPAQPSCGGSLQIAGQAQQQRCCELQNGIIALPVLNANAKCSGGCQPTDVRWSNDFWIVVQRLWHSESSACHRLWNALLRNASYMQSFSSKNHPINPPRSQTGIASKPLK